MVHAQVCKETKHLPTSESNPVSNTTKSHRETSIAIAKVKSCFHLFLSTQLCKWFEFSFNLPQDYNQCISRPLWFHSILEIWSNNQRNVYKLLFISSFDLHPNFQCHLHPLSLFFQPIEPTCHCDPTYLLTATQISHNSFLYNNYPYLMDFSACHTECPLLHLQCSFSFICSTEFNIQTLSLLKNIPRQNILFCLWQQRCKQDLNTSAWIPSCLYIQQT